MSTITYETLLNRMLARVPDTVDKREGSIIYDALAPAAAELVQAYIELESYLDLVFVDTSEGDYLTRLCNQFGITREDATYAVRKGTFYDSQGNLFNISIGSRFTIETLSYEATSKISDGIYNLTCEQAGESGNKYFGKLIPVDYIEGLATATLGEVLIPGEDEEDDDTLKERYLEFVQTPTFGGNIADYKRKVKALDGVGSVKVYPVWNGGGTVKLVLLNTEYEVASSTLVDSVQQEVDPTPQQTGLGIAPIGHIVTVQSAEGVDIDVSTTITLQSGYTLDQVKPLIQSAIESYFLELNATWEDGSLTVRTAYVDSRILALDGVLDIQGTTINSSTANIALTDSQVPVLGELVVTV